MLMYPRGIRVFNKTINFFYRKVWFPHVQSTSCNKYIWKFNLYSYYNCKQTMYFPITVQIDFIENKLCLYYSFVNSTRILNKRISLLFTIELHLNLVQGWSTCGSRMSFDIYGTVKIFLQHVAIMYTECGPVKQWTAIKELSWKSKCIDRTIMK